MAEIAKDVHEVSKDRYWNKDTASLKTRDTDALRIKQYQYKTNYD